MEKFSEFYRDILAQVKDELGGSHSILASLSNDEVALWPEGQPKMLRSDTAFHLWQGTSSETGDIVDTGGCCC